MVFKPDNADFLIATLDEAVAAILEPDSKVHET
jgi:hypothetical protein